MTENPHRSPLYKRGDFKRPAPLPPKLECGAEACKKVRHQLLLAIPDNSRIKTPYLTALGTLRTAVTFTCEKNFATCPHYKNIPLRSSFGFPRSAEMTKAGEWEWHRHFGIDLFGEEGQDTVHAVVKSRVLHIFEERDIHSGYADFGNTVILVSETRPFVHYLYGHLALIHPRLKPGSIVEAGGLLGFVGQARYAHEVAAPHLHFEVSKIPFDPHNDRKDPQIFNLRIDPITHLEMLGPHRDKTLFFPIPGTLKGNKRSYEVTETNIDRIRHSIYRNEAHGGHFPIGENRCWHGGIHLHVNADTAIRAPFSGDIVAVRLDADSSRSAGAFGCTNFILLRHDMPFRVATSLREEKDVSPIYSLFMHLPAAPELRSDLSSMVQRVPWLSRVIYSPPNKIADDRAAERQRFLEENRSCLKEILSELNQTPTADLQYKMVGDIFCMDNAPPNRIQRIVNGYDDVQWVKKRLSQLGYGPIPINEFGNHLLKALVIKFQKRFVANISNDELGTIQRESKTAKQLKKTLAQLNYERTVTPVSGPPKNTFPIDERFLKSLINADREHTPVVVGFHCRVAAGEVIWHTEPPSSKSPSDNGAMNLHWEIFSESRMVHAWPAISARNKHEHLVPFQDNPIFEAIESKIGQSPLTSTHIRDFFKSTASDFAKRTEVRFTSEWGQHIPKLITLLKEQGYATMDLSKRLSPYIFWPEALRVLPESPFVWHIHPIEFLEMYQAHLRDSEASFAPKTDKSLSDH